jgi:hypothetical protein
VLSFGISAHVSSISVIHRWNRTRGRTAPSFSHCQPSCPHHEPCLTLRLTPALPPLPTSNWSSMLPWRHIRRRRNAIFSPIPLPPSYSPATPPPPSYLPFKTSSSNSIAVAQAMRDYQIGLTQQSTSSTRFLPLSVKVLSSLVSVDYLPRICDLIVIFQIWSPANVVFSGIGVLLSVSIIPRSPSVGYYDTCMFRRLKM